MYYPNIETTSDENTRDLQMFIREAVYQAVMEVALHNVDCVRGWSVFIADDESFYQVTLQARPHCGDPIATTVKLGMTELIMAFDPVLYARVTLMQAAGQLRIAASRAQHLT